MKRFFYFLLVIVLFACGPQGAHVISGDIEDAGNMNVYLDKITFSGQPALVTNTEADANGNFEIVLEESLSKGIYRLRVGAKSVLMVISPEDQEINVSGTIESLGDNTYTVTGSPSSIELQNKISDLSAISDRSELDNVITSAEDPLINTLLVNQVYKGSASKINLYKDIAAKMDATYPDLDYTKDFNTLVNQIETQAKAGQGRKYKFEVGEEAPDIAMPNPDGEIMKLSELEGKVVLIDFWASWCRPCRKANPHVVEIYEKYNDQGFEIYSVSLDGIHPRMLQRYNGDEQKISQGREQAKQKWLKAIEDDNLKWDYHVSDLDHWGSAINQKYGVSSIPTTFLVGRDGTFAAINPRNNLEEAVQAAL